jgi:WD40 repeat protein
VGFAGYLAMTADLQSLAVACADRTVRLYDVPSGHLRGEIPVLSHHIFGMAFNRDATVLASVSLGTARWDSAGELKL